MNAEEIARSNHTLDRDLARHGYIQSRASEFILVKPIKDPRIAGDHARFMCQEVKRFLSSGDVQRALRWLRFAEGISWALGIYTLEEIHTLPRMDE